ncbi:MAG TPA: DNA-binding response regulator [Gammaproteobacteria bacterium]|nr:DNA-binding response regulator [Gammaproteobacteria bacterium]
MTTGNVLLVEDHLDIAEMVWEYLESKGYVVDYASDGVSGFRLGDTNNYDVIILDIMLPGLDGLDVCQRLRKEAQSDVPVLMLTARDTLEEKLSGFDHGADDYLVKPFALEELEARLAALIRRNTRSVSGSNLSVGSLIFDAKTLQVTRDGLEITVSPIGLKILQLLMRRSPRVVPRRDIEREIWGDLPPDSDALRSHMYTLRKVIDKPFGIPLIRTVHGAGFRLTDEV